MIFLVKKSVTTYKLERVFVIQSYTRAIILPLVAAVNRHITNNAVVFVKNAKCKLIFIITIKYKTLPIKYWELLVLK